jgi:hypothetical protein
MDTLEDTAVGVQPNEHFKLLPDSTAFQQRSESHGSNPNYGSFDDEEICLLKNNSDSSLASASTVLTTMQFWAYSVGHGKFLRHLKQLWKLTVLLFLCSFE